MRPRSVSIILSATVQPRLFRLAEPPAFQPDKHQPKKKRGRRKEHLKSFSRFEFADTNWKNRNTSAARHS
jgi:hypothetical protein